MQLGRAIDGGNPRSLRIALCGALLMASIALSPKLSLACDVAAAPEPYASANELYDFKMPGFQLWLRENRLMRQPSEGDTDFTRRVFLALEARHQQAGEASRRA